MRKTSREARWARHNLQSSKKTGCLSVTHAEGQPQAFQLYLTHCLGSVSTLVQMFRPGCYSSFSQFSAKLTCSCAVSSSCPGFCGVTFQILLQLESAYFSWKTQISFLLVFFPFLLPLIFFLIFSSKPKRSNFLYGSKILAVASLRLISATNMPLCPYLRSSKSLVKESKASCGGISNG